MQPRTLREAGGTRSRSSSPLSCPALMKRRLSRNASRRLNAPSGSSRSRAKSWSRITEAWTPRARSPGVWERRSSRSRGAYVVMGDADDSYDFSSLAPFLEELRRGSDLVVGNRFKGKILPGAMPWKHRWIGNPVLTAVGRILFRSPVGDFHCGLRAFRREAFDRMDL